MTDDCPCWPCGTCCNLGCNNRPGSKVYFALSFLFIAVLAVVLYIWEFFTEGT